MTTADRITTWTTVLAVVGVAAVAAVASYEHSYALVRAHGEAGWTGRIGHGPIGAAVAAWPAVALVGSYELLMMVIRASQMMPDGMPGKAEARDPLQEQAAEVFADQLAADRVPSVRAIREQLHVGQPRAQRLRDYLAAAVRQAESLAA
jgi:hypothetical protein